MPDPIRLCHLLVAAAILALLWAAWQASIWLRNSGSVRGTPQYARARDGRRFAVWSLALALLLLAIGCLTPLGRIAIG